MLNIQKIFEAQERLDKKIVEVHVLEGKNLTGDVTQALYVELGELAQEIGFFKYWKKNKSNDTARQHEEWADCMHFVASLANKYGHSDLISNERLHNSNALVDGTNKGYHELFETMYKSNYSCIFDCHRALAMLILIGLKLGMTYEDMEKSYFSKNQVNYDRLASGY